MVFSKATAVFIFCLLSHAAARLCGGDGVLRNGDVCEQEGQVCGHCKCNSSGRWACEDPPITATWNEEEKEDDCATVDFHQDKCKDWQEGMSCGDCTCVAQKWVCAVGALVGRVPLEDSRFQERELQISDEECEAINTSNQDEACTEPGKICGNCFCDYSPTVWRCARQGDRIQQCLGVEDGKFCRWIERGEKCGDCECMPNNQWACPAASTSLCDEVDDGKFCSWADRGSMCGTCFCANPFWACPERLCDNIFPGKFCLWRNRGRKCFGCECVANKWVCPETTPTRQELCADEIVDGKRCLWRDEGRMCGECVCLFKRWNCPAETCPMINSCSGEHSIEAFGEISERIFHCTLPAGLRGLELTLEKTLGEIDLELSNAEWVPGAADGQIVLGEFVFSGVGEGEEAYEQDPDLYAGESPGTDLLKYSSTADSVNLSWNPDFPTRATVYGYEVEGTVSVFLGGIGAGGGTMTYRWTCNEDPALACACALE